MNFYNKISSDEEEDEKDSYDSNENLNAWNKENIFENILYNPNISNSNNNTKQTVSIKKETNLEKNFLDKKQVLPPTIISPIGEIKGNIVQYHLSYIIYERFKYELTKRI